VPKVYLSLYFMFFSISTITTKRQEMCPCWQGLLFWQLAELQSKVRSDVSSEYWLNVECAYPDRKLFDWGMMRLRRPSYGVGDPFAMDADDRLRKKRDSEVIFYF
jgi:hypothetical protein